MKARIDHIVVSVKNLKRSMNFYSVFLGKPKVSKWDASWQLGLTKLFLTSPYEPKAHRFDKHNLGLNHIAFGVSSMKGLKEMVQKLEKHDILNSGVTKDKYSGKNMIWFDDPDKIRLEFFLR